jgi:hypothetical protein
VSRTIVFRRTIQEPWLAAPSHALGAVRPGAPDLYALVRRGSLPELRLDLYADGATQLYVYQQALEIGELLAVGFGHEVHHVPPWPEAPRTIRLRS